MLELAAQTSSGFYSRAALRGSGPFWVGAKANLGAQLQRATILLAWFADGEWADLTPTSGFLSWFDSSPLAAWEDERETT